MKKLSGKIAIITGATKQKGLGQAVAIKLASLGATVILAGREKSKDSLECNVKEIESSGWEATYIFIDMSKPDQIDNAVNDLADKFGRIDILVNNAGVGFGSAILNENENKDWDINYSINVKGALSMCKGVLKIMEKEGSGAIVNVASTAGIGVSAGMPYPYIATKHALVGATKALALEYADKGIRVNVVAPGAINTDMLQQAYAAIAEGEGISISQAAEQENSSIPLGRPAEPFEVAAAIAFLASDEASYITGVVLPVSGGLSPGI
ncbi:SDR family NAD(P)-dependent oxidoreductase [Microbulbifer variabilis]|jgi:3-oxoacyl-[acyl-carrier protein] reductase|uniref:SDR family oxidoreductase n=1 Tax=Microbulbifer variabilis TaxID=266805 RepID=A0ABY4V5P3_9GAMM|nr:SDR family NAD(P)-dependent oxidoreductase [Microbulbifer variabilis]USD19600.1 SDR family oxidoreductase [Microbulbifer variabilis]